MYTNDVTCDNTKTMLVHFLAEWTAWIFPEISVRKLKTEVRLWDTLDGSQSSQERIQHWERTRGFQWCTRNITDWFPWGFHEVFMRFPWRLCFVGGGQDHVSPKNSTNCHVFKACFLAFFKAERCITLSQTKLPMLDTQGAYQCREAARRSVKLPYIS